MVFECKVKHDPSLIPTITWLKDSEELPDDERYLHMLNCFLVNINIMSVSVKSTSIWLRH